MKDKFIQKIQGMLKIKKLTQNLRMHKDLRKNEVFLQKYIDSYDMHYVE